MEVKQFEYKPLAHYSYALISDGEMAIIDPERDPSQYYAFAKASNAQITAIIQTHPHADFVSSHLELSEKTGAPIYNSSDLGADYDFKAFDDRDSILIGSSKLEARETPGHSPDSITIIATHAGKTVLFTGDTLFIGDVGRPDLREKAGNLTAKRRELAEMMYETVTNKFTDLPDDAVVYPAHGAGSLCGKNMSDAASSTLGDERKSNWAFNTSGKDEFLDTILEGQPFIPSYFSYDVELNKKGAPSQLSSLQDITWSDSLQDEALVVDTRAESEFKKGHLPNSINIQAISPNAKFETWLGSIITPEEKFALVIPEEKERESLLERTAKIGYEILISNVTGVPKGENLQTTPSLDLEDFKQHPDKYTIVDIRNQSEIDEGKIFDSALEHPLNDLRKTASEIPTDKPIVVHCAGGYRSAAGSSILAMLLPVAKIYDLSEDVKKFN
ncbi:MAG: rhodanese-like domain-containing protein [Nonlabens sp.]